VLFQSSVLRYALSKCCFHCITAVDIGSVLRNVASPSKTSPTLLSSISAADLQLSNPALEAAPQLWSQVLLSLPLLHARALVGELTTAASEFSSAMNLLSSRKLLKPLKLQLNKVASVLFPPEPRPATVCTEDLDALGLFSRFHLSRYLLYQKICYTSYEVKLIRCLSSWSSKNISTSTQLDPEILAKDMSTSTQLDPELLETLERLVSCYAIAIRLLPASKLARLGCGLEEQARLLFGGDAAPQLEADAKRLSELLGVKADAPQIPFLPYLLQKVRSFLFCYHYIFIVTMILFPLLL
jgi:hypothetical protein